jgi:peptidoglycan hydrolase-like protein with peptidoglycan-binding domain
MTTVETGHVEVDVPFTPILDAVRVGGHTTFDRVVFQLEGPLPGHDVQYVPEVVQDGSGIPIPLRGRAFLQVSLFPATALSEEGPFPVPAVAGLAALREIAFAGDFEAVTSFGIGVAAQTPVTVLRLETPSRVVIDVAHTPPGTGTALLRRGDSGAAVATWQWRLRLALSREIAVDEAFGPLTEAATKDLQRLRGITADGIVGPVTRARMETALGV